LIQFETILKQLETSFFVDLRVSDHITTMDYVLLISGVIAILLGVIGSILPGLPGPPAGYLGLLLLHWTKFAQFSTRTLVIFAIIVIIVSVLDYVVPIWGTKKFGGSRSGVRGSTAGLIVGVLVLPLLGLAIGPFGLVGIIGGPFIGAYIAERMTGRRHDKALRAAFGSFIGFLAGTIMKIVVSIVIAVYFILAVIRYIF